GTGLEFWNSYEILEVNDEYLINPNVRALVNDSNNKLWIGTAAGITIFENGRFSYDLTPDTDELPSLNIYAMLRDSQNRIWIGTDQGLSKIKNGTWTPYTDIGLNSSKVIKLAEIDSTIYAGTEAGVAYYDGSSWVPISSPTLPEAKILSIAYYNNSIYLAVSGSTTETGLYSSPLDPGNWNFSRYSFETGELTNNNVTALYVDNLNRLVIGNKYGLDFYSANDGWYSYNPEPGDKLRIFTKKPFSSLDSYQFTSTAAYVDEKLLKNELGDIAVVPNPYVATAIWEPKPDFVVGRGERKIYFINLPSSGTIRIYTLNGELVKKIRIDNNIYSGAVSWNLLNEDNLEIAYGLYIYHVETESGTKIGKFAIIK
ncbi:T9SS type A sorting domain-containing protein, partial [bacterium]|nr:T9SS type A sorting domain-containing protein [bacterium]